MTILHIDTSINQQTSTSRQLSRAIVDHLGSSHQTVAYRDLDANPLPHLSGSPDEASVADNAHVLKQFQDAKTIVLGVPMYNFGVPSTLKSWIDRISVAGQTFRYTEKGPEGLAGDKTVIIASSRGSALGNNSVADFQESYLKQLFGFLGVTNIHVIRAEGLAYSPEHKRKSIDQALEEIQQLGVLAAV